MPFVIPATPQQQQAAKYYAPLPSSVPSGLMRMLDTFMRLDRERGGGPNDITPAGIFDEGMSHYWKPFFQIPYQEGVGNDFDKKMREGFGFKRSTPPSLEDFQLYGAH